MERAKDPLDMPFLDAKAILQIFGGTVGQTNVYAIMHKLLGERDEKGNLLIDPARMPPVTKLLVPTDAFCKKYGIKRHKKKTQAL